MVALASGHSDGEILGRAMHHLGWNVVRGSTTRGGVGAMLRLLRDDATNINLTPDGPQGPRRTMAPGAVYLASRLKVPVVCVGYAYNRPWRLGSWDRFAVPRPFSRGRAVFGPPITVPGGADRAEREQYRLWLEDLLNWLTAEAERWAADGQRRPGEVRLLPGRASHAANRPLASTAPPLPTELAQRWAALTAARPVSVAA